MNDPQVHEMCQLIYYDFSLNDSVDQYLQRVNFFPVGKNYNTIAIIGPQSTGKSTLLNRLFDTNFEVMATTIGRGQTTKGLWIAGHAERRVLILDCEGTDSKERGEDRNKFEHSSSLFSLAMADVLIMNMWTSDVGRYTASNYGVLKIVFEMNLKLFQQECAKKILIVLRDFDPKRNLKSKIEELILKDIYNIWGDIKKPEKYKDCKPDKFFEFEFVSLPHKKYAAEDFEKEVAKLRQRLDPDNAQYLFKNLNSEKNIPADGIKQYVSNIWNDILNEKDLNIPSQKEMLANYRCTEIRDLVLIDNEKDLRDLNIESSHAIIEDFKEKCLRIFDKAMQDYDKTASNYVEKIYLNIRKQLEATFSHKFFTCLNNQATKIIPMIQKFMRLELEKDLQSFGDNYFEMAEKKRMKYLNILISKLNEKKVFDFWTISEAEYSSIFDEIIENQRRICLDEKKNSIIKTLKKEIEESFHEKLDNYSHNLWIDFNRDYVNFFAVKMFPYKNYFKDNFKMTNEEIEEFAHFIENEVYTSVKKDAITTIKDIATNAIELFKKKFWYENGGTPRHWNRLEEEEIEALFKKYRAEYIEMFASFKLFKVLQHPLKYLNYLSVDKSQYQSELEHVLANLESILERESENFEELMRQNEITSMRRKYEDGVTGLLEDAKRRREGVFSGNLPVWFWILLVLFGYDDLIRLVRTKWILPVLLLIGLYYLLHRMNKTHIVRNFYFDIEETITKIRTRLSKKLRF